MQLNGKRHHIHSCVNKENIEFEEDEQNGCIAKESKKKSREQPTRHTKSKHEENKLMKRNSHDRATRSTVRM